MLTRGRVALLAVMCCAAVLVLTWPPSLARADSIRNNQQWVLSMMNMQAAWQVT